MLYAAPHLLGKEGRGVEEKGEHELIAGTHRTCTFSHVFQNGRATPAGLVAFVPFVPLLWASSPRSRMIASILRCPLPDCGKGVLDQRGWMLEGRLSGGEGILLSCTQLVPTSILSALLCALPLALRPPLV